MTSQRFSSLAAGALLWILVGASLATFARIEDFWWQARTPSVKLITSQPKELPETVKEFNDRMEAYEKRADDLEKLVSILLGLTTIYGIALGVNAYQQAKDSTEKLDKIRTEASNQLDQFAGKIRSTFPVFADMDIAIRKIMDRLMRLLPVIDWSEENYQKLTDQEKQEILFYEKTVAAFEYFDLAPFRRTASEIYHGLGNFYGLKYAAERKEHNRLVSANQEKPGADKEQDSHVPDEEKRDPFEEDMERARFYLDRAIRQDDRNIGALNDRGFFALTIDTKLDLSRPRDFQETQDFFNRSLRADPSQQRARYNLAWMKQWQKDYAQSEAILTEALALKRWQEKPSLRRRRGISYNRACSRVCLAGLKTNPSQRSALLGKAWGDLEEAFPGGEEWDEELNESFLEDIKKEGELYLLLITQPFDSQVKQKFPHAFK